jgi:glycosyltransferase involved in cell wall biosynthesis
MTLSTQPVPYSGDDISAAILMPVYRKDDPDHLILALEAIVDKQTRRPDLVLVVQDGPLTGPLEQALLDYAARCPCGFETLKLPENVGLSMALRTGAERLVGQVDYIIRTDADDISRPERIAEQLAYMQDKPEIGLASSQVAIFEGSAENQTGNRHLPFDGSIEAFARMRTPINHSAAIFRAKVLETVSYPETRLPFEDWWVSLRVMQSGWKLGVIDKEHLDFRGGDEMIARRRGLSYLRQEFRFFGLVWAEGLMSGGLVLRNLAIRTVLRIIPVQMLETLYKQVRHRS